MASTEIRTPSDIQGLPVRRYEDMAVAAGVSRISWGSVFAGSAIGLVLQLWLSMLGVAIGASTIDPLQESNPLSGMAAGSIAWLGISILISSYVGGWVAGRYSAAIRRGESAVHGAAAWAVCNIAAFLLVGTVFGNILSGAAGLTRSAMSAAGSTAAAVGGEAPVAAGTALNQAGQALSDRVNQAIESGQAEGQAREAGDAAAKTTAATSWGIVTLMLLGLCSGLFGAYRAKPVNPAFGRLK